MDLLNANELFSAHAVVLIATKEDGGLRRATDPEADVPPGCRVAKRLAVDHTDRPGSRSGRGAMPSPGFGLSALHALLSRLLQAPAHEARAPSGFVHGIHRVFGDNAFPVQLLDVLDLCECGNTAQVFQDSGIVCG
jgi:hypothetical protein